MVPNSYPRSDTVFTECLRGAQIMSKESTRQMKQASVNVTARVVAELTGFSISTVGRALADDSRISSDTKAKVKQAAERCGYVGNMPARIMRGGSSNLVGLILPDVRNDFYASIAQALTETCGQDGRQIILSITNDDREAEARSVREFASGRVAGVIAVPSPNPKRETIAMLKTMPCVQLLRKVLALGDDWFGIDDENALHEATSHLIRLGHRRIAYVGGQESLSTGASRLRGVRSALRAAAIGSGEAPEYLGPTTAAFGEVAVGRLGQSGGVTAIVSGSVHISLGIIAALERSSTVVPGDISLIGFGDPEWFSWWRGGVTTIRPPTKELAQSCGVWFMRLLSEAPIEPHRDGHSASISSTLVIRRTVAKLSSATPAA